MPTREEESAGVALGLRVAVATTVCLFLTEVFRLRMSALSVYSANMVMSQFTFTAFQKGVERVAGRALGVAYGIFLILFFRQMTIVYVLVMGLGMLAFGYVYASNRLAYAGLNAVLFIAYMGAVGMTTPQEVSTVAVSLLEQIVLGVGVAFLVNWASGGEESVVLETRGEPLWPLRWDWLNRSALIATVEAAALLAALVFDLPVLQTTISAGLLAMSADWQAMRKKALQRILGGLLGGLYALVSLLLLRKMPQFPLLLALVFFGMFLAAYFTKAGKDSSYVFLQMGLVMPLVLIGERDALGSLATAVQRFVSVVVGLLVSEVVYRLWPHPAPPETAPDATQQGR